MRHFLGYLSFVALSALLAGGDSLVAAPPQSQGKTTKQGTSSKQTQTSRPSRIQSTLNRSQLRTVKPAQRTINKLPTQRNLLPGKLPPYGHSKPGAGNNNRHPDRRATPIPRPRPLPGTLPGRPPNYPGFPIPPQTNPAPKLPLPPQANIPSHPIPNQPGEENNSEPAPGDEPAEDSNRPPRPAHLDPLPKLDDLGKLLKKFHEQGNNNRDPEQLDEARQMAVQCLGLEPPCFWWCDFCCFCWWDWCCCNPWFWNCWDPCDCDFIVCPRQVVVVNGAEQVYAEVSYYLGIKGFQIPNMGFAIQEVHTASPAKRAGLAAGDILVTVCGQPMDSQGVMAAALQQYDGVLDLVVLSGGAAQPRDVRVIAERVVSTSF